jgi:ABC-type sugar transport system, periplasmic component
LEQGRYLALIDNRVWLVTTGSEDIEIAVPSDTREELTLACSGLGIIMLQRIYDFNRENEEYKITILNYSQFEDRAAKPNLDIIAGNAPDMICWSMPRINPIQSGTYSKAEQLVDLYALLDRDADINRATFLPNLLDAVESSTGALYELPLEFSIYVSMSLERSADGPRTSFLRCWNNILMPTNHSEIRIGQPYCP